jgi:hypothetical protein
MKIKIPKFGNLTDDEVKFLKSLPKMKSKKRLNDVEIIDYGDARCKEFVDRFFRQRIGKRVEIESVSVFAFSNVDMHVDNVSSRGRGGLIFMTGGRGSLTHFSNRKSYNNIYYRSETLFLGKYILLNDKLPHSFSTNGICHALIADVSRSYFA